MTMGQPAGQGRPPLEGIMALKIHGVMLGNHATGSLITRSGPIHVPSFPLITSPPWFNSLFSSDPLRMLGMIFHHFREALPSRRTR